VTVVATKPSGSTCRDGLIQWRPATSISKCASKR
jgi:hypothetical protein